MIFEIRINGKPMYSMRGDFADNTFLELYEEVKSGETFSVVELTQIVETVLDTKDIGE